MVRLTDRFEKHPDIIHRKTRDEFILLPVCPKKEASRQFYFFEEVGEQIWELLDGNRDCREIVEKVSLRFGARQERVQKDIFEFLNDLAKEDLIRRRS